jgi:general secretion pathway protein M
VAGALLWWVALGAGAGHAARGRAQHRALDAQLQHDARLQAQAQAMQAQPQQATTRRCAAGSAIREQLGTSARYSIAGERVTVTLSGTAPRAGAVAHAGPRQRARAARRSAGCTRNAGGSGTAPGADPAAARVPPVARALPHPRSALGLGRRPASALCVACAALAVRAARWLTGGGPPPRAACCCRRRGTVWNGSGPADADRRRRQHRCGRCHASDWHLARAGTACRRMPPCCTRTGRLPAPCAGGARERGDTAAGAVPAALLAGLGTPWTHLQFDGSPATCHGKGFQ